MLSLCRVKRSPSDEARVIPLIHGIYGKGVGKWEFTKNYRQEG